MLKHTKTKAIITIISVYVVLYKHSVIIYSTSQIASQIYKKCLAFSYLTEDVFVMLWDELLPLTGCWMSKVHVDETVAWSIQVRFESKYGALVRHIFVLSVKVVDQLHPRQQPCCDIDVKSYHKTRSIPKTFSCKACT